MDVADLAMQFVLQHEAVATTLVGMSKVRNVERNLRSVGVAPDPELLATVLRDDRARGQRLSGKRAGPENDDPGAVEKQS